MKIYKWIFVFGVGLMIAGCGNNKQIENEKYEEINSVESSEEAITMSVEQEESASEQEVVDEVELQTEEDIVDSDIVEPKCLYNNYSEYMWDRALVNMDYEDEFGEYINENPIDKEYVMGPNITTEDRIVTAAENRDCWRNEIEYALTILQDAMEEEQYNMLQASYENWETYTNSLNSVEKELFYLGGLVGDSETYPHVTEVEATRTKDYAVQLLALEYAVTGDIEFAFGQ